MAADALHFLRLMQWLSPAYPVGAYTYSHGLEWAVEEGRVGDARGFAAWAEDVLNHGAGRNDAILLAAAWRAPDPGALAELDALARALAPSRERALEAAAQGAAFWQVCRDTWDGGGARPGADAGCGAGAAARLLPDLDPAPVYPVAVGAAAAGAGLPLQDTALAYLHALAGNLTAAAIRLVPLGQTEGQAVLAGLAPLCADLAETALHETPESLGACTFLADIASMKHETQYSRLFRS